MNTTTIGIGIAVVVAMIGGFYFISLDSRQPVSDVPDTGIPDTSNDVADREDQGGMFTGSVKSLAMRGGSHYCEVSSTDTSSGKERVTTGAVYIDGTRMRSDFSSEENGMVTEMSMISDGEWMYTWSDDMPQGMKMKIDTVPPTEATDNPQPTNFEGAPTDEYTWDCDTWTPSDETFVPPSAIPFMEIGTMGITAPPMPSGSPQL